MKIEYVFQDGLKRLIATKPLEEINVVMLCKLVDSNRQTFYYHFRDISDVVESIFLRDLNVKGKKAQEFEVVFKEMIAYINSNYRFIESINKSYASDKFESFLYSYFYMKIGILLKNRKNTGIDIIRYISVLSAHELTFWVASRRKEKTGLLIKRMSTIWRYLVNQYESDMKRG